MELSRSAGRVLASLDLLNKRYDAPADGLTSKLPVQVMIGPPRIQLPG